MNNLGDHLGAFSAVEKWVTEHKSQTIEKWLNNAKNNIICPYYPNGGNIGIAFQHAFRHLWLQTDYYDAIDETISGGGDTDTNGIIVGGLLGACYGLSRIPELMRKIVLECNTNKKGRSRPRPNWLLVKESLTLVPQMILGAPSVIDMQHIRNTK